MSEAFSYNPIDVDKIESVDIVPQDDSKYQEFLSSIYESSSNREKKYEKWIRKYPKLTKKFKELAEYTFKNSKKVANFLEEHRICGNCWHSKNDKYRKGSEYLVCWKCSSPDIKKTPRSRRPKKITFRDDFAKRCEEFSFENDVELKNGKKLNSSIYKGIISNLRSSNDEKREKACIEYSFKQTIGLELGESLNWNREYALLSELDVNVNCLDIGEGGRKFEEEIKQKLSERFELEFLDNVFRIEMKNGDIIFKEMDAHFKIEKPIILEIYKSRLHSEKKKQIRNYKEIYKIANSSTPDIYLVTEMSDFDRSVFPQEKSEDELVKNNNELVDVEGLPELRFDELSELFQNKYRRERQDQLSLSDFKNSEEATTEK